ncbi:MAG: PQQ-binding-like beta-propeller repeat protein [Pirellulales bacterium]
MEFRLLLWIGAWATALWVCPMSRAGDWPMYRADAARRGYSPDPLPASLELRWMVRSSPPRPAWPSSERITYDFAHQPILANGMVVAGSTCDDSVVALDVRDGQRRWRFFTGGPVRFAPVYWRDRVFVASDDGRLYALSLADGRLLWVHRGGPNARMCLGNERMISRWPARGGPVVMDDTVYYTAGIWPSGGVYIHALDAATGKVVWSNDRTGQLRMPQPHGGAQADSGVAPQGYLLADDSHLFVPTGRAVPAAFHRADGQLEHYLLQENGSMGGARALIADRFLINGGCFLEQDTGKLAARAGRGVFSVLPDGILQFTGNQLLAYRWEDAETQDAKGNPVPYRGLRKVAEVEVGEPSDEVRRAASVAESLPALGNLFRSSVIFKEADAGIARQTGLERTLSQARPDVERLGGDVAPFQAAAYERTCEIIAAGDDAICGSRDTVSIVDLKTRRLRWSHPVEGAAIGLAAAGGSLLVSTTEGLMYCFAEPVSSASPSELAEAATSPKQLEFPDVAQAADEILRTTGIQEGFCLDLGCGDGRLALALVRRSQLHVVGLEADPAKVARARRILADAGVYGDRVSIHEGELSEALFPQYFADLIVSSAQLADRSAGIDNPLITPFQRPGGGTICFGKPGSFQVQRRGPLSGAGVWTHQNSNAANTLCSDDALVRGPLEMAWYRDGVLEIVDRHAQGPAPLYNRGTLVVEGVHGLCGLDAYNGRTRWVYPIENILADWDGVHHDVGVGDTGSNICLGDESVYVRTGSKCLKIDLETGRKIAEFKTPVDGEVQNRNWGYVAFSGGLLFGSVLNDEHAVSPRYRDIRLRTESVRMFALDASTGEVCWTYQPEHSLRNNAIAIAGGRVYLIDRPLSLPDRIAQPQPNGKHRPLLAPGEHAGGTLVALDAGSGEILWKNDQDIWGTQLAVSSSDATLLMYFQGVKHRFFKLPSEIGGRLAAFATDSGQRLWDREAAFKTRPIINGNVIYAEGGAWDLKTGEEIPWEFQRSYGCGQISASRHLMLFRSATLGYLDLSRDAGTENFGGIRPSCWFNAIPAGGLVLVPDGSSKCACSYQMRAWLALQPSEVN